MHTVTVAGKRYKLDAFTLGYFEAALWSSTDNSDDSGGDPLDANYDLNDFAAKSLKAGMKDCAAFQRDEAKDLEASGLDDGRAGHLFWLNRNGHGVGFWDDPGGDVGERLSKAAHVYGGVDLYVGDDGKIHGD